MTATPVATPPRSRTGAATWSASSPRIDCARRVQRPAGERAVDRQERRPRRAGARVGRDRGRHLERVVNHPDRPDSRLSGQRTERCHQTEGLAQARGSCRPGYRPAPIRRCGRGHRRIAGAAPIRPAAPVGGATEKRRPDRRVSKTGPSISSSAMPTPVWLSPIDGARRRRSGFVQYPDVVDDAVRRYLREVDGKPLRVVADNLGQMS